MIQGPTIEPGTSAPNVSGGGVAVTMHATGVNAYSITEQQLDHFASNNRALHIGLASACATACISALLYLLTGSDAGREVVWGLLIGSGGLGGYFGIQSGLEVKRHHGELGRFKDDAVVVNQPAPPSLAEVLSEVQSLRRLFQRDLVRRERDDTNIVVR